MSSDTVIRVENLSKCYKLRHSKGQANGEGLRHAIQHAIGAPFRALRSLARTSSEVAHSTGDSEDFWAINQVSFDVKRGEVLGVIGRNGAGKSTLLKVLSRITEPTKGRIGIKGRVASLLEVGTGFHPELTGRENIFLNGAILGMTRSEVRSKFDEIVEFAGVSRFLETPVKHYSSGMYVRLAFAVAAHLEPEILVVDEVLAVGDIEFQKKCLGKMKQVAQGEGRTVLFVSHNMAAVEALCSNALFLTSGSVECIGETSEVLQRFRKSVSNPSQHHHPPNQSPPSTTGYQVRAVESRHDSYAPRSPLEFEVKLQCPARDAKCQLSVHIFDESDVNVATASTAYRDDMRIATGSSSVLIRIKSPWLLPGSYRVGAFLHEGGILHKWDDACRFEINSNLATNGFTANSDHNVGASLCDFELIKIEV